MCVAELCEPGCRCERDREIRQSEREKGEGRESGSEFEREGGERVGGWVSEWVGE